MAEPCLENSYNSEEDKFDDPTKVIIDSQFQIVPTGSTNALGLHFFGPQEYNDAVHCDTDCRWLWKRNGHQTLTQVVSHHGIKRLSTPTSC